MNKLILATEQGVVTVNEMAMPGVNRADSRDQHATSAIVARVIRRNGKRIFAPGMRERPGKKSAAG
jgi:hypothetical protein